MMSLRVRLNRLVLALTLISTAVSTASAEPPCDPAWNARFGGHHDLAGVANDAVLFDGPRGPEIVVGGVFHGAGSVAVNNIARWNGRSWQDLLGGVRTIDGTTATVRALLAMPPQTSARRQKTLIVGGSFHRAGDVAASNIASWDGASWASLAGGLNGAVAALTRWTHEGGDVVVAGGAFDVAGGVSAPHVAQWDGDSWQSLGSGISFEVTALGVSPVADGNELFAACAPGSPVLRWNGSAWVEASQGLPPSPFMSVRAFARANLGDGDFLYAAIDSNDGLLYRWQREAWTPVGGDGASHPTGYAISLDEITVDGAPALAISGDAFSFPDGRSSTALTWDGRSWAPLPADDGVGSCGGFIEARLGDATGDDLYALAAGTVQRPFGSMARYDGAMWRALSPGNSGVVHALLDWTAPHGETLMIGGGWLSALGGEGVRCIAAWNGREWTSLGGTSGSVEVLAVHDDGTGRGTRLYAGGEFGIERQRNQESLAAWDGHRWEVVPEIEGVVGALATFDDGSGPALYVGGSFHHVGDASIDGFGRWDGAWSSAGAPSFGHVSALCVWDDGSGSALYVGAVTGVWRWDGTTWSTVGPAATGGTGVPVAVERMIGTASGLYVGSFIDAWNPINTVSRWDGRSWETNVGGLAQGATSFCLFDDGQGHGEELYIGINGEASGGGSLLRWDGNEWSTVAEAPGGPIHALLQRVRAGGGRSLVLGGAFVGGPHGEAVLAEWDACVEGCEGDVDGDGAVGAADLGTLLGSWGEQGGAGDVDGDGVVTSLDLAILLGAWGPCE